MQEEPYSAFQNLQIFENAEVNQVCDALVQLTLELTGDEFPVCGSVARMFDLKLPEAYHPKDVDFVARPWAFRMLRQHLNTLPGVLMIEKRPHRIICFTNSRVYVEIFEEPKEVLLGIYKNKIKYKKYDD